MSRFWPPCFLKKSGFFFCVKVKEGNLLDEISHTTKGRDAPRREWNSGGKISSVEWAEGQFPFVYRCILLKSDLWPVAHGVASGSKKGVNERKMEGGITKERISHDRRMKEGKLWWKPMTQTRWRWWEYRERFRSWSGWNYIIHARQINRIDTVGRFS